MPRRVARVGWLRPLSRLRAAGTRDAPLSGDVATLNSNGGSVRDHRGLVRAGARGRFDADRVHGAHGRARRRVRAGNGLDASRELSAGAPSEDGSLLQRHGTLTKLK